MKDLELKLSELNNELELVHMMGELEACEFCGTDTKEDGIEGIMCEIEYYQSKLDERNRSVEEEDAEPTYGLDPAFSSWYQVNSMFV